jgi:NAD(P)-dependent dehydrogenase (short-subunit alcohol dehydrogenase family)
VELIPKTLVRMLARASRFDAPGFVANAAAFDAPDLDVELSGKVCLVTGANSGLGYEAAAALARRGAQVWMLCRHRQRGLAAQAALKRAAGHEDIHLAVVDLSSLSAVTAFAAGFGQRVDVLVHNAGLLPDQRQLTDEGYELTWATHVLGPHRLTRDLLPQLHESPQARVIFVSSGGMYTRRLNLKDPNWDKRAYDGVTAYAETKRAQVVLAELWSEHLADTSITVNSTHPGWADTGAVRQSLPRFSRWMQGQLRSAAQGADTIVWLAAAEKAAGKTGLFWFDRKPRRTHVLPNTLERSGDREQLWELCCEEPAITREPHAMAHKPGPQRRS